MMDSDSDSDGEGDILENIASYLTSKEEYASANFCIIDEFTLADIKVEEETIGILDFPLGEETIEKLLSISSDAPFGLENKTLLDKNVRDTQVIAPDKLKITINDKTFSDALTRMGNALGLAKGSSLIPHLHNMLIYGPGQFFDVHQDTEKLENMIATLVIVLPSSHIGGDLIIEHGTKKHTFSSEGIAFAAAKCIAFYSDCKHKVEKIKSGHRITLTYNLVLKSEEIHMERSVDQQLKESVQEYFESYKHEQETKLVYFLNHTYTEHGLKWNLLKGEDLVTASDMYAVATDLDLVIHLGLVEICESWDADSYEEDYYPSRDEEVEVDELLESTVNFSYWLDAENKKLPYSKCHIKEEEICETEETATILQPFKKKNRFTGNEGNTVEFWYRRAAVILWEKTSQIPLNFKLNYNNALNDLYVLTTVPGNEAEIIRIMEKAGMYVFENIERKRCHCCIMLTIALYHKDPVKAQGLSHCIDWKDLNPDIAEGLAKLQAQYGVSWCVDLLNKIKSKDKYGVPILDKINNLMRNFLGYGGQEQVMELVLDEQCGAIIKNSRQRSHYWTVTLEQKVLPKKMERFYEILDACAAVKHVSVQNKIVQHLIGNPDLYPESRLAELLLRLLKALPSDHFKHFESFQKYVFKTIEQLVGSGGQSEDDWSIKVKLHCNCEECKESMKFLHSKTEITKRRYFPPPNGSIHARWILKAFNLPVSMDIENAGFGSDTLILTKNEKLHDEAKKRYNELEYWYKQLQDNISS